MATTTTTMKRAWAMKHKGISISNDEDFDPDQIEMLTFKVKKPRRKEKQNK